MPKTHLEIERKYEVAADAQVPTFEGSAWSLSEPHVFDLRAEYYDTHRFTLAQHRIAVRHRTGGSDAGWHIKQRHSTGVDETEWPPQPDMPEPLVKQLETLTAGDVGELQVVGRIDTKRTSRQIMNELGVVVAELVDDAVTAQDVVRGIDRAWREWEVEVVAGDEGESPESLLDSIEEVLVRAGALPSLAESKIGRTMGSLLERAERSAASAETLAALAVTDVADRLAAGRATNEEDQRVVMLRRIARNLTA